ncbi:hypothetical protein DC094_20345 [Pelagibaculum spongiae]|uniref:Uncharacterized protein n=2 Tax=Pelagibaculum spongiae TaxID=2080658 RepID=A0A2V1GNR0_9GAMM|nr:hypothetical protein DC094_20345 [Pelagibaculum spongiae]
MPNDAGIVTPSDSKSVKEWFCSPILKEEQYLQWMATFKSYVIKLCSLNNFLEAYNLITALEYKFNLNEIKDDGNPVINFPGFGSLYKPEISVVTTNVKFRVKLLLDGFYLGLSKSLKDKVNAPVSDRSGVKIIHRMWLGKMPSSEVIKKSAITDNYLSKELFEDNCYRHILWTNNFQLMHSQGSPHYPELAFYQVRHIDELINGSNPFPGMRDFVRAFIAWGDLAFAVDILRLLAVYQYGGLYLDISWHIQKLANDLWIDREAPPSEDEFFTAKKNDFTWNSLFPWAQDPKSSLLWNQAILCFFKDLKVAPKPGGQLEFMLERNRQETQTAASGTMFYSGTVAAQEIRFALEWLQAVLDSPDADFIRRRHHYALHSKFSSEVIRPSSSLPLMSDLGVFTSTLSRFYGYMTEDKKLEFAEKALIEYSYSSVGNKTMLHCDFLKIHRQLNGSWMKRNPKYAICAEAPF